MYDYAITIDGHTFGNDDISEPKLKKAVATKGFPIGEVVVGSFTVSIPPGVPVGEGIITPFSERAEVQFGVTTEFEQLTLGTYFIAKRKHSSNFAGVGSRVSLTCYDRLAFTNQSFDMEGDEKTEVNYIDALTYIAEKIGCAVDIPLGLGGCYFRLDRDRTMREVLSLIAGATGTNCMMSRRDVMTFVKPFHDGGNYYGIPNEDRTEPFLGREWKPLKVTVYNDKDSFSAGDGDFLHEVKLQNDAASQEMADRIYADLQGHAYLPYKVPRAKVPLWLDLFDNTNVWIYENNTGDSVIFSYSFIANLSMDFLPDCAYATFAANDVDDVRDEFAWFTDHDKIKRDEKNSTVQIGNRYGMKSVKITNGGNTVGAKEAETVTEARFDNAEITFKDKTDLDNPIDCGKLYVDDTGNANLETGGLLTEAQDVRGAINELFAQGTSDSWVRPAYWIDTPEPEPNQIVLHVEIPEAVRGVKYMGITTTSAKPHLSASIDWGDGTTESRGYDDASGIIFGYDDETDSWKQWLPGQYAVVITLDTLEAFMPVALGGYLEQFGGNLLGIKLGAGISDAICTGHIYLHEFYWYGDTATVLGDYFLMGLQNLRKVILPPSITSVGDGFLTACRSFCDDISLPNLIETGADFATNTLISSVNLPKVKKIGGFTQCLKLKTFNAPEVEEILGGFDYCLSLRRLDLPKLKAIGNNSFNYCYDLSDINCPALESVGSNCFSGNNYINADDLIKE